MTRKEIEEKYGNDSIGDMTEYLEEYYECAGFADFYERVLKKATPEAIREMYFDLKEQEETPFEDL